MKTPPAAKSDCVVVYQLHRDKRRVEAVQRATLTTRKFGIARTHGLFGSDEWWEKIKSGKLAVHTVHGVITRLYMGGMRDTPEFKVRSDTGKESSWLRHANGKALGDFYAVGRRVEIDYVLQRGRICSDGSFLKGHKVVVEVRIGSNVE